MMDGPPLLLRLDNDGRVQPFLIALGIGLNGIKGDVLVALGMPAIQIAIVKGAVGFQDVVNPLLKCRNKTPTAAFEEHVALADPGVDL